MSTHHFNQGDFLFREGDVGDHAFLLECGEVEVLKFSANGDTRRLGTVGPGDVLGEMSLIDERPRSRSARAISEVKASRITQEEFQQLLVSDPSKCFRYLRSLFERLRTLEAKIEEQTQEDRETAGKTPGNFLLRLFPLSRKTAQMLPEEGLAVETFPCRLGRASEAKEPEALALNDIWLLDEVPFHVSRNHMLFDLEEDGRYIVRDRGSKLGTIVNEHLLGGESKNRKEAALDFGDNVVILGNWKSPFRFRVKLEREF